MKITAKKLISYELIVNHKSLGTFKLSDKWKRFVHLVNEKNQEIYALKNAAGQRIIESLCLFDIDEEQFIIVSCSPSLMGEILSSRDEPRTAAE